MLYTKPPSKEFISEVIAVLKDKYDCDFVCLGRGNTFKTNKLRFKSFLIHGLYEGEIERIKFLILGEHSHCSGTNSALVYFVRKNSEMALLNSQSDLSITRLKI